MGFLRYSLLQSFGLVDGCKFIIFNCMYTFSSISSLSPIFKEKCRMEIITITTLLALGTLRPHRKREVAEQSMEGVFEEL